MDKQRKKQIKKYITWGIIALLVLLLAVMPLLASKTAPADGPQASILTAAAENRTVKTQLIGGGLLSSNATEEITIPAEIKLTEYLVGNGDIVKEGDPIATVDKVSVLTALAAVQETLDHYSGKLASAANSSDADEVKAHAGGLVKILYGEAGDSVREVMLEHGALAVLSLDGRMAVEIQRNTDLESGSSVCVYLEDDTELEGRVESSAGGKLVVSIKDNGYAIGEKVTVKTEDGDRMGSGTLYIHNAWNATAYYGTISGVRVKEGDSVSAGKILFDLKVGDYSANFQILNATRQEYEELMTELFQMYDSGVITAPCDGIVTGVDTNGTFLLSASQEQTWQVQLLRNIVWDTEPAYTTSLLTSLDGIPSIPDVNTEGTTGGDQSGGGDSGSGGDSTGGDQSGETPPSEEPPAENVCTNSPDCTAPDDQHVPGCPMQPTILYKVTEVKEDRVILQKINSSETKEYFSTTYADGSPITVGQYVSFAPDGSLKNESGAQGGMPSGMPNGMGGGMPNGMSGMGSSVPAFEPYTLETLTVASVTSQEEMTLEITLDEQDIASIFTGQEATITVEALTGQTFPATVTSISNTGTNEGGNSKFTAKLTLNKSGDMLPGMNASAFLTLDSEENTLTVPVAALVEDGTKTMVYTGYNEKSETFTGPVEVTTGVSDGEYVQILSGLSSGDTVYYAYYDTPEVSNIPEMSGFRF